MVDDDGPFLHSRQLAPSRAKRSPEDRRQTSTVKYLNSNEANEWNAAVSGYLLLRLGNDDTNLVLEEI